MKTNYNGQKIVNENETIYIGEPTINLTVSSGIHKFYACRGIVTITSPSVVVHLGQSQSLQIINYAGAKTFRGGYGVGDLFISTVNESPALQLGGIWEQINEDAYLKIVPTDAGELSGTSSTHQIPVASLPPHGHMLNVVGGGITADTVAVGWTASREISGIVRNAGSGNPYYPYYYGLILWKRSTYQDKE